MTIVPLTPWIANPAAPPTLLSSLPSTVLSSVPPSSTHLPRP